jgi:hypothetical protein
MLDHLSGYKSFGYEELTEYQLRVSKPLFSIPRRRSLGKEIINHLGHTFVHFGQWLIRLTELPQTNLANQTDMCSHYGD